MIRPFPAVIYLFTAVGSVPASAAAAAGQVSIQAVDAQGRPMSAVQVEWYAPGELLGTVLTGPDGVAEIPADRWDEAVRVHLRFLGLETRVVQRRDLPADGVIRMEPSAIAVEGLTVEAHDLCPLTDEPAARRVWSGIARQYSSETGDRARSVVFRQSKARVSGLELRQDRDARTAGLQLAQSGGGVIHGGDRVFRPLSERTRVDGYAWPPFFNTVSVRQLNWAYPELDRLDAHHFASPAFGELHDFAILEQAEGETTVAFCGRPGGDRPVLAGILTLIPERRFLAAEWRFETPHDDEGAGGWVTFDDLVDGPSRTRHLVAAAGAFYRKSLDGPDRYVVERTTEARWRIFASADHPCTGGRSVYGFPAQSQKAVEFSRCMEAQGSVWEDAVR